MFGSLLMLGSTNKKLGKINYIFAITWIIYMLINADLESGINFAIINIAVFAVVFFIGKVVKGEYSNKAISILSIIIWSVIIDMVCYYMYPQFNIGDQSILFYIGNGIAFNSKFALINAIIVGVEDAIELMAQKQCNVSIVSSIDKKIQ